MAQLLANTKTLNSLGSLIEFMPLKVFFAQFISDLIDGFLYRWLFEWMSVHGYPLDVIPFQDWCRRYKKCFIIPITTTSTLIYSNP